MKNLSAGDRRNERAQERQEACDDAAMMTNARQRRRITHVMSQPFHVAENFTGTPGKYVKIEDTLNSMEAILGGECDDIPEQAFLLCGTIDDVRKKSAELK